MSFLSKTMRSLGKARIVSKNSKNNFASRGTTSTTTSILAPQQFHRSLSTTSNSNITTSTTTNSIFTKISSSFLNIKSRYSFQSQRDRVILASSLFQAIRHQAHNPQWYYASLPTETETEIDGNDKEKNNSNKLKPEFRQIHAMLSMHVWFIHRRLLAENKSLSDSDSKKQDNLLLQEEIFDMFWIDTQARIRALGVNEMTVNKHLEDAQRATFIHCTQYDHAFGEYPHDVEKRFEVICDAVWRHVLGGEDNASDELIRKIGAYVEYQLENVVFKLPDDYLNEGRVAWGDIPDMNGNDGVSFKLDGDDDGDDNKLLDGPLRGMTFLQKNWVQVLTIEGKPYYWNMDNDETRWERP